MKTEITQKQAQLLIDNFNIGDLIDNDEDYCKLLKENNPELLEAYYALYRIANGANNAFFGGNFSNNRENI